MSASNRALLRQALAKSAFRRATSRVMIVVYPASNSPRRELARAGMRGSNGGCFLPFKILAYNGVSDSGTRKPIANSDLGGPACCYR